VLTTFLCCRAVAPGMIARRRGAIDWCDSAPPLTDASGRADVPG